MFTKAFLQVTRLLKNLKTKVKAAFQLDGNTVHFKLDKYDKNSTLIIDPTEIFSTFVGSISDDWGYTATYDNAGNFYAGGIVFDNGFDPRHVGGYDQTFNGGDGSEGTAGAYDVSLMKFNPTGYTWLYMQLILAAVVMSSRIVWLLIHGQPYYFRQNNFG